MTQIEAEERIGVVGDVAGPKTRQEEEARRSDGRKRGADAGGCGADLKPKRLETELKKEKAEEEARKKEEEKEQSEEEDWELPSVPTDDLPDSVDIQKTKGGKQATAALS